MCQSTPSAIIHHQPPPGILQVLDSSSALHEEPFHTKEKLILKLPCGHVATYRGTQMELARTIQSYKYDRYRSFKSLVLFIKINQFPLQKPIHLGPIQIYINSDPNICITILQIKTTTTKLKQSGTLHKSNKKIYIGPEE